MRARALAARGGADHRGHQAQVVGAEDEVELREAAQQRVALLLRDAAPDAEQPARAQRPSTRAARPRSL